MTDPCLVIFRSQEQCQDSKRESVMSWGPGLHMGCVTFPLRASVSTANLLINSKYILQSSHYVASLIECY